MVWGTSETSQKKFLLRNQDFHLITCGLWKCPFSNTQDAFFFICYFKTHFLFQLTQPLQGSNKVDGSTTAPGTILQISVCQMTTSIPQFSRGSCVRPFMVASLFAHQYRNAFKRPITAPAQARAYSDPSLTGIGPTSSLFQSTALVDLYKCLS